MRRNARDDDGVFDVGRFAHPATHVAAGRDPGRDLAPVAEAELGEDVLHVVAHRAVGEDELLGDLAVGPAQRHQLGDLAFARGQRPGAAAEEQVDAVDPWRHAHPFGGGPGPGQQRPGRVRCAQAQPDRGELARGLHAEARAPMRSHVASAAPRSSAAASRSSRAAAHRPRTRATGPR